MNYPGFSFEISQTRGAARAGRLSTPHGSIETPVFMPVGTQASVKSVDSKDLEIAGAQIILGNTYHLYLRPGPETIERMGGLHNFMRWQRPILTDSGGFQVSSLGTFARKSGEKLSKVDDDGVTFMSHIDGSEHRLTPEKSIEIQEALGADIIMAFDEATPNLGKVYAQKALERTQNWLERCIKTWQRLEGVKTDKPPQALFGIIQGGRYPDLQVQAAERVANLSLPGLALGGESIGGDMERTQEVVEIVKRIIPAEKPLYAMGLGTKPSEVVRAIEMGIDMFDCVAPTRLARCGLVYSGIWHVGPNGMVRFESPYNDEKLMIEKSEFADDASVLMPTCDCYTCAQGYTRAYLHHLFKARELSYYRLATIHNLRVMIRTAEMVHQAIVRA